MVHTMKEYPIKHANVLIPYLTLMSQGNWTALCVVTWHFITDLRGRIDFRSGEHAKLLINGNMENQCQKAHEAGETLSVAAE